VKLGIFAKTFGGHDPLTVLQAVKDAGFSQCHYNMSCSGLAAMPAQVQTQTVTDIQRAVNATGVSLCGLSATFNMVHPDRNVRDTGLRSLDVLGGVAKDLDITLLTLCTGSRDPDDQWRHHPDNPSAEAWKDLCQSMAAACVIAERHGVYLGIEPETANVVNSSRAAERLLKEMGSDRIRFVIDPANLFHQASMEEQQHLVFDAINRLMPCIAMAHAKDRDATGQAVAAGQGVVDFEFYFKQLHAAGFGGSVVTHGLAANDAVTVRKFLETYI
jgi:sugar phosphate isomerase/epimerase